MKGWRYARQGLAPPWMGIALAFAPAWGTAQEAPASREPSAETSSEQPEAEATLTRQQLWRQQREARQDQLERYRDQNAELRRHFNFFALVPEGDRLAASYLKSIQPFSYERLGRETLAHLESLARMSDREATRILDKVSSIRKTINLYGDPGQRQLTQELNSLAPYFASLPKGELAVQRSIRYARQGHGGILTPQAISDAVRHHLYDNVLYATEDSSRDNSRTGERILAKERYPSKV